MKKLTLGILCLTVCAGLTLSSCQKQQEDTADNSSDNSTVSDLAGIVLPKDEEEQKPLYEYDYSGDGATLTAYNGDLEEVVLDETVIRMKKEKQKKTVTEEVKADDGTVSTVEKEVEETVEVPVEYTLTAIEAGVFMNNESVKKIVIPDFEQTYMTRHDIHVRSALYVSIDTKRKVLEVVKKIGSEYMTATSYVENIVRQHLELYKDDINRIYKQKGTKNLI